MQAGSEQPALQIDIDRLRLARRPAEDTPRQTPRPRPGREVARFRWNRAGAGRPRLSAKYRLPDGDPFTVVASYRKGLEGMHGREKHRDVEQVGKRRPKGRGSVRAFVAGDQQLSQRDRSVAVRRTITLAESDVEVVRPAERGDDASIDEHARSPARDDIEQWRSEIRMNVPA